MARESPLYLDFLNLFLLLLQLLGDLMRSTPPCFEPWRIEARIFDAAVLDMNLNGIKSFPVADKLAALGVPFVFSTGYSAHDMRDGYRDRPLLKKPIRSAELAAVFACLLPRPPGALEA